MNSRSVSRTQECSKARRRVYVSPPFLALCLEQSSMWQLHFHVMSPHTVLSDYYSHLFLQLLLTGWHLVAPAVTPVRPLWVFVVHVPLPFLYGQPKAAAAAYMYFAGPLVSLLPTALSQGAHHDLAPLKVLINQLEDGKSPEGQRNTDIHQITDMKLLYR